MYSDKQSIERLKKWLGAGSINIFGRPFSGKDTQSKRLSTIFDAPIIGGGDIIRNQINNKLLQKDINQGKLAPQKQYLDLVIPYLSLKKFNNKPLILNSLGRWHGEEDPILNAAQTTKHPIKAVIVLSISEDIVWDRWELSVHRADRGKRNDDNKQSIATRLIEYKDKTIPVINYYKNVGLLIAIDGLAQEDKITNEIVKKLLDKAQAQ